MPKRVIVVQQFFYPDLSAVAQLLNDLLVATSSRHQLNFTVLAGSTVRAPEGDDPSIRSATTEVVRFPAPFTDRLGTTGRLVDSFLFHLCVFTYLLFLRRDSCVVCMTTPPLIGFTVALASHVRPAPFIHYIEDLFPEILLDTGVVTRPYIAKKLSLFNRVTLRIAERIIVIGDRMKRKLYLNYGVSDTRVSVIENWAAPVDYHPPGRLPHPVFMYSGNLGYAHGFRYLKEFISLSRDTEAEFSFVGAGRRYNTVRRELSSVPGLNVRFRSYVPRSQHSHVLAEASFFLLAQSPETVGDLLPSKFYSYLAAGRPIVFFGTRQSEIGELIERHRIGITVETRHDLRPALEAVRKVFDDAKEYSAMCQRVRAVHLRLGGVTAAADKFAAVLMSACCGD